MNIYQPSERFWMWTIRLLLIAVTVFLVLGLGKTCGVYVQFTLLATLLIFPLSLAALLLPRKCSAITMILSVFCIVMAMSISFMDSSFWTQLYLFIYTVLQIILFISALHCWLSVPSKARLMVQSFVVFTVLLVCAYMGMPNVTVARIAAKEASAVGMIRTIQRCANDYKIQNNNGYPVSIAQIQNNKCMTQKFDNYINHGYLFTYRPNRAVADRSVIGFSVSAIPANGIEKPCDVGQRSFFGDETGIITWTAEPRSACAADKPL